MKRIATTLIAVCAISAPAFADDFATAKDAEAMVAKVAKLMAANPKATLDDINTGDKKWFNGEVYPTVNSIEGMGLANAQNPKNAGKDLKDLADMNGKEFIKERIELAKTKGKFWHEFMWKDPVSKKVLTKQQYCERTGTSGEYIVCAGIYKR